MSLLRRRAMMECKKEYAGTLYIDAGFLSAQVRYDGTPVYNAQFPNAWATTYATVALGDIVSCDELTAYSDTARIRQYYIHGYMTSNKDSGAKITIKDQGVVYIRLMVIDEVAGQTLPSELTVTHPNGTIDTYKIIDRR